MATTFGQRLKQYRTRLGLTQKELAEILGILQSSLSSYETDKNTPTIETLINMGQKMRVSLDWLCGLEGDAENPYISDFSDIITIFSELFNLEELDFQVDITNEAKPTLQITCLEQNGNESLNFLFRNMIYDVYNESYNVNAYLTTNKEYKTTISQYKYHYKHIHFQQKKHPDLSRKELLVKRNEFLNSEYKKTSN